MTQRNQGSPMWCLMSESHQSTPLLPTAKVYCQCGSTRASSCPLPCKIKDPRGGVGRGHVHRMLADCNLMLQSCHTLIRGEGLFLHETNTMDTYPGPGPVLDEGGCGREGDLLPTQDKVTRRTMSTSCCTHVQLLPPPPTPPSDRKAHP